MDWFRNPNPATDPALLEQDQRLLWLWNIDDERRGRLVHPLEAGAFGRKTRADVDVTVIRDADDFSSLSFRGNLDEPLDLSAAIDEQEFTGTDDEKL